MRLSAVQAQVPHCRRRSRVLLPQTNNTRISAGIFKKFCYIFYYIVYYILDLGNLFGWKGKGRYGSSHPVRRKTRGCAGKTMKSFDHACHTRMLLGCGLLYQVSLTYLLLDDIKPYTICHGKTGHNALGQEQAYYRDE